MMKKRLALAIIFSMVLLSVIPAPALAMDEPDSVYLYDIEIFQDLLVENDFLAVASYHIPFTLQPDANINETFLFQLFSPDGSSIVGSVLAYPRYNGGYGYGIVSFYFETGMTWNSSYIFRVYESPVYYPSPKYWNFTIGASNYSSDSNQKDALRSKILDSAKELSTEWSVDLLSTSDSGQVLLSTYGELYYLYAIPGLQSMAPALFSVQIESPTYTKRSWSTTFADAMQTKYAGTIIGDFMTGFAGMFSMQTSSAMNIFSIIIFVVVILLSTWKFKATTLSAFIDGYSVLLLLMLDGFFSMVLTGFIAFLSIMIGGIILFFNRS